MHFLPDVYVTCEVCRGRRYNRETLEILYKRPQHRRGAGDDRAPGAGVLRGGARRSGRSCRRCRTWAWATSGSGQAATTLSGGEAQRIKLAKELSRRATGRTLYLLDEPTTGLHFDDIKKLLAVLDRLVDQGNTVIVIEHNLDVIKTADWIVDLGPEGGDGGGRVVATGTPEQVAPGRRVAHRGVPAAAASGEVRRGKRLTQRSDAVRPSLTRPGPLTTLGDQPRRGVPRGHDPGRRRSQDQARRQDRRALRTR